MSIFYCRKTVQIVPFQSRKRSITERFDANEPCPYYLLIFIGLFAVQLND